MGGTQFLGVVVAVVLVVTGGCSPGEGMNEDSSDGVAVTSTAAEKSDRTTQATSSVAAKSPMPPLDPAAIPPTREVLEDSPLGSWIDAAVATPFTVNTPCSNVVQPMDVTMLEDAVEIADVVLGELLLNFDAAAGALGVACTKGDTATARDEAKASQALQVQIATRLEEVAE